MDIVDNDLLNGLGLTAPQSPEGPRSRSAEDLGVTDFLELMLAQVKNQDPFEPMENGAFISQLAEFGTVSGIEKLQGSFASLSESIFSNQALEAASLIGRQVQVETDSFLNRPGEVTTGVIELPSSSPSVTLRIVNGQNQAVRSIEMGSQQSGAAEFIWDGRMDDGAVAPAGYYQIVAEGLLDGQTTALTTTIDIPVNSVALNGPTNNIELELENGDTVSLSQVKEIR